MSHHHGAESPFFLKRVLIPFWIVRVLVMLICIAAYALLVGIIAAHAHDTDVEQMLSDNYGTSMMIKTIIAYLSVMLFIVGVCLLLDIICIIKRARHTLMPPFFLGVNIFQTLVWTVFFILGMLGPRSAVGVGVSVVV